VGDQLLPLGDLQIGEELLRLPDGQGRQFGDVQRPQADGQRLRLQPRT